ncbi:MAG: hypothetical protein IPM18_11630 [Phycisphaerales bacterium]|nr:hypothetical protein [Phycisphaerales bacterium]
MKHVLCVARVLRIAVGVSLGLCLLPAMTGCTSGGANTLDIFSPLFPPASGGVIVGPVGTGRTPGSSVGTPSSGFVDPCDETQQRKFVRITMRNSSADFVHYFLAFVAFVNSEEYPDGAVCPTDIALYTSFGYQSIPAGAVREFGNYCIVGPALLYFHRSGQFRGAGAGSTSGLGSAIAPAQGATSTFDTFFNSAGATVPVPDLILFHNPGTTAGGQALKVSRSLTSPCSEAVVVAADPVCQQDAFYYVDDTDRVTGSTALGVGSGRRVPSEIQGTGCECLGLSVPAQVLAPSGRTAITAQCNEFFRGGRIEYVFLREDLDPPYPQLVWRVTDSSGARAHDFDPRSGVR